MQPPPGTESRLTVHWIPGTGLELRLTVPRDWCAKSVSVSHIVHTEKTLASNAGDGLGEQHIDGLVGGWSKSVRKA